MRIGIFIGLARSVGIDDHIAAVQQAVDDGLPSVWLPQVFSYDALALVAVIGRSVPGVALGTAVVPTYPRHPIAMAQAALTAQAASGGRHVLGIGLSHEMVIAGMYGYSFDRPARHMREYLSVLLPLLRGEPVDFKGETVRATATLDVPGVTPPPVLLAALAPRMLELAGGVADGTITWMTGTNTLRSYVVPSITAAAGKAGRGAPRVAVGLPVCVTDDVQGARDRAARSFSIYDSLPSYRAMLDREGAEGPADVAVVGDEAEVGAALDELAAAGATDFLANEFGSTEERARTRAYLRTRV